MKKVHVVFVTLILVSFLFTNCTKEENVFIDEPEMVDPIIDEPEIDDPVDEDEAPQACIIRSIEMRGSATIEFEYTNNRDLASQVIETIALRDNEQAVAKGQFEYNGGVLSKVTWRNSGGRVESVIEMNNDGAPEKQFLGGAPGQNNGLRTFFYKGGVLDSVSTKEADGDIETLVFKYFPGTTDLVSITEFKNGRERRSKRFEIFDQNANPFASFGLFLMDYNSHFSDNFWPTTKNPKQINDKFFDDIKFEYSYNELNMPETASWVFFTASGTEIINKLKVEYECE